MPRRTLQLICNRPDELSARGTSSNGPRCALHSKPHFSRVTSMTDSSIAMAVRQTVTSMVSSSTWRHYLDNRCSQVCNGGLLRSLPSQLPRLGLDLNPRDFPTYRDPSLLPLSIEATTGSRNISDFRLVWRKQSGFHRRWPTRRKCW